MQMQAGRAGPHRASGRHGSINHGRCNFCYQPNTDQKGSLSPPLTCETSQLYSLEMTGALNSRTEQTTAINHAGITMSRGAENYFCIESPEEFMKGGREPKVLGLALVEQCAHALNTIYVFSFSKR